MKTLLFILVVLSQVLSAQNFGLASSTQPKCFGDCNGSITFTTSTVSGPFTAVVSNGSTCPNSTVMNSSVGSISISSICACSSDYTFTIYNQNAVVVGSMVHQFPVYATSMFSVNTSTLGAASCYSCCDGYAYIVYSGGNTNGNPAFTIDGISISAISPASTLCPGSHTVCGTDPSGCETCHVFSITATAGLNGQETIQPFRIVPNPASDFVQIIAQQGIAVSSVLICDLSGRVQLELNTDPAGWIDLRPLHTGIYTLQLRSRTQGLSRPRKLVISH